MSFVYLCPVLYCSLQILTQNPINLQLDDLGYEKKKVYEVST